LCRAALRLTHPQPQGRSFAELDLLFEKGVSARKFASTRVDVFDDVHEGEGEGEGEKDMKRDDGKE
jgi:SP family general alpha glucoside:H+ symporter-like MFS transporter